MRGELKLIYDEAKSHDVVLESTLLICQFACICNHHVHTHACQRRTCGRMSSKSTIVRSISLPMARTTRA